MLLVFDIGNTSTSMGVFDNDVLVETWKITSDKKRSSDEYGIIIKYMLHHDKLSDKITNCVISSVVPPLTETFKTAVEDYLKSEVMVLSVKLNTGLTYDVKNPKEIGTDRIANALAAYKLYKKNCVVVDFGTATTFDIVSDKGVFLGGVITPGIGIQSEALSSRTSKLPKVKVEAPKSIIGKDTIDNILSGLVYGHASMIDGMIESVEKELGSKVMTIATGGYSKILTDHLKRPFDVESPNLTLEGLRMIFELNK